MKDSIKEGKIVNQGFAHKLKNLSTKQKLLIGLPILVIIGILVVFLLFYKFTYQLSEYCPNYFKQKAIIKKTIFYSGNQIIGADYDSFSCVIDSKGLQTDYAKDKKNVYFLGNVMNLADPGSFKLIGERYSLDSNGVYRNGNLVDGANPFNFNLKENGYATDYENLYYQGQIVQGYEDIGQGYAKFDNEIYYNFSPISGADYDSFQLMELTGNQEKVYFGKDKNNLYMDGIAIQGSDPKTFEKINKEIRKIKLEECSNQNSYGYGYGKTNSDTQRYSNDYHYNYDECYDDCDAKFDVGDCNYDDFNKCGKRMDDKSYEKSNRVFYKDNKYVYVDFQPVSGSDGKSFKYLDYYYAKDNSFVYIFGDVVPGSDGKSFRLLGNTYAKDNNFVYCIMCDAVNTEQNCGYSNIIYGADPKTFQLTKYKQVIQSIKNTTITRYFAKDKNNLYIDGVKVDGVKGSSFQILNNSNPKLDGLIALDNKHVYFSGEIVNGIDGESFKLVDNNCLAKDKNGLHYYNEKGISRVNISLDPESFSIVGGNKIDFIYMKDKNYVYYGSKDPEKCWKISKIEGVNSSHFELSELNGCIQTEGEIYCYGKISGMDKSTLNILNGNYAKDKDNVYYSYFEGILKIGGADPNSFIVLNENYAKDANYAYFKGQRIGGVDIGSFKVGSEKNKAIDNNCVYQEEKCIKPISTLVSTGSN